LTRTPQSESSKLKTTLRNKELQLAKTREEMEVLDLECRALRVAVAIQDDEDGTNV